MLAARELRPPDKAFQRALPTVEASWPEYLSRPHAVLVASALFVLVYVAVDAVSFVFPYKPLPVTPWNPNAGLAIAMILGGGARYAPAVILAAVLSELPASTEGVSLAANVGAGAALGACYVVIGLVVRRLAPASALERLRDLRVFMAVVVAGTAVATACYVLIKSPGNDVPGTTHAAAFVRMWVGELTGTVSTAPLLLLIGRVSRNYRAGDGLFRKGAGWAIDIALFLFVLASLLALIFGLEPIDGYKLFYLLFVPLIALAMRRGFAGAAIGVAIVQLALIGVLLATLRSAQSASEFQLLMLVLAMTTLLLGAVASERERALGELERHGAELRAQQSALGEAQRVAAASEMASALAHELAQPLSAIGSYARAGLEMLRLGTATPADLARALERVERETARSGKTVRRIRDFFRSGASQLEPVAVELLVDEAIAGVHDRVDEQGAELRVTIGHDLPRVYADRLQIGTVLHNLLTNALDAALEARVPPIVEIAAQARSPDSVIIDVTDSGRGVAASVRESLFEPLATTKPGGMGLGLAISRTIVQAHAGQLVLLDGPRTTFRLTLPAHGDTDR